MSEADVQEYYDTYKDDLFTDEQQVRARHILFSVSENDSDEAKAETRTTALGVLERARDGEDFASLAEEFSQDEGTAEQGGDLGFFGRGRMVEPFEEAAFSLDVGQISDLGRNDVRAPRHQSRRDSSRRGPAARRRCRPGHRNAARTRKPAPCGGTCASGQADRRRRRAAGRVRRVGRIDRAADPVGSSGRDDPGTRRATDTRPGGLGTGARPDQSAHSGRRRVVPGFARGTGAFAHSGIQRRAKRRRAPVSQRTSRDPGKAESRRPVHQTARNPRLGKIWRVPKTSRSKRPARSPERAATFPRSATYPRSRPRRSG